MKLKIFILLFLVFFGSYLWLSFLNPDTVKFYYGGGQPIEMSVASFVVLSFVLGIIMSSSSVFSLMSRALWRLGGGKAEKKNGRVLKNPLRRQKRMICGWREKAIENLQKIIRSAPYLEETYVCLSDIYTSMEEYDKAIETLDLGEINVGKKESILLKSTGKPYGKELS